MPHDEVTLDAVAFPAMTGAAHGSASLSAEGTATRPDAAFRMGGAVRTFARDVKLVPLLLMSSCAASPIPRTVSVRAVQRET
jgi:hypothetical protein